MLKKSASGVLASLRGSTYGTEPPGGRNNSRGFSVRQDSFKGRTAHTKCGTYLLASSLAAALLDGLFEHPARVLFSSPRRTDHRSTAVPKWFFLSLLAAGDPFLTVRPIQMIEDIVGFRQHDIPILKDWNIVLA